MIQSAVLKSYREERERSKQPGYVCTYDDFDSDYDTTYTQVAGEMGPAPRYRTHGSHGQHGTRGAHTANHQEAAAPAARKEKAEGFGAGIL